MDERSQLAVDGSLLSIDGQGIVRLRARFDTDIDNLWTAITAPERLALWYGDVRGDLRDGGEFVASVFASGSSGRGRIDVCLPPRRLELTMLKEDGESFSLTADLTEDGDGVVLAMERRGVPLDLLWAFGAGWHGHLEDLAAHAVRGERVDHLDDGDKRFNELASTYREMTVSTMER